MTYYLAYGMNTNLMGMANRCPAAKSLGKVQLPNHKLKFRQFCDVEIHCGTTIECVLWTITDQCERSLDRLEGYPDFYLKKEVDVIWKDKPIKAMIYYMSDLYAPALPSEYYFQMVLEGYKSHNMSLNTLYNAIDEVLTHQNKSIII